MKPPELHGFLFKTFTGWTSNSDLLFDAKIGNLIVFLLREVHQYLLKIEKAHQFDTQSGLNQFGNPLISIMKRFFKSKKIKRFPAYKEKA